MKNKLILYFIISCLPLTTFGKEQQDPFSLFSKANLLFREKKYKEAIAGYETLIREGHGTKEVYFNLGNSYFKDHVISKAIVNYERAKKLDPADEDILFNLRLAYSNTVDKIEPVPVLFYQRWWQNLLHLFSPGTWNLISIVLFWVTLLFALLYLFANTANKKRNTFLTSLAFLGISLFFLFLAYSADKSTFGNNEAVISATSSYIRSSPDDHSTKLFMLHEGTKVIILDEMKDWKQIKIANGNVGWLESSVLEKI